MTTDEKEEKPTVFEDIKVYLKSVIWFYGCSTVRISYPALAGSETVRSM